VAGVAVSVVVGVVQDNVFELVAAAIGAVVLAVTVTADVPVQPLAVFVTVTV
jgi:hypothetical protein